MFGGSFGMVSVGGDPSSLWLGDATAWPDWTGTKTATLPVCAPLEPVSYTHLTLPTICSV
eukprot:6479820-Alexandrium_andersonii.AAC.1